MSTAGELKTILKNTRHLMAAFHEIGLPPPRVAKDALELPEKSALKKPLTDAQSLETEAPKENPDQKPEYSKTLENLRTHVGDCRRCGLHKDRKHLVFGEGDEKARLVFVGEGPGYDEDQCGRPFVGKAGQLLTRIIENGMGLTRDAVYICNVVKCRPPGNRDPQPDEIKVCLPFLKHQLRLIAPDVICGLGRVACQTLLGPEFRITRDRGKWREYDGIPFMPTFHPAYLLRNESAKRPVWEDVKAIMNRLGLEVKRHG